jgi:uncharacterized protein YjbI with pentapeptide repeats
VQLRHFRFLPPSLNGDCVFDGVVLDGVVLDGVVFDGVVLDGVVFDFVVFDFVVFDFVVFDFAVFDGSLRAILVWTKSIIRSCSSATLFFNTDGLTKGVVVSNCGSV